MVVVERQPALAPTTAPMTFANPANGTPTILLLEKSLVLLGGLTMPANLIVVVGHGKAIAAVVLAISESRELFRDLFLPTGLTNRQAVTNALVVDSMEALPN
jgi:F0F1-type ATP synthase membrane subunit c/vacuolar-type H+-ATPase subunit K